MVRIPLVAVTLTFIQCMMFKAVSASSEGGIVPVLPDTAHLLELAYDVHHGEEIMEDYGNELVRRWRSDLNSEEGSVLSAALRNNPAAARKFPYSSLSAFVTEDTVLNPRMLSVLSSIVSTADGLNQPATSKILDTLLKSLSESNLNNDQAVKVASLVRTLSHTTHLDEAWASSIQKTIPSAVGPQAQFVLLKLATDMATGEEEFKGLENLQPEQALVKWLALTVKNPSPSEQLQDLVKSVRHRVFGNPKAARNHFDEL